MKAKQSKKVDKRKKRTLSKHALPFPEITGKIVESVECHTDEWNSDVSVNFNDGTALNIFLQSHPDITVKVDYADWTTGNWRPIKRWQRES
jgi:hypothetical protein